MAGSLSLLYVRVYLSLASGTDVYSTPGLTDSYTETQMHTRTQTDTYSYTDAGTHTQTQTQTETDTNTGTDTDTDTDRHRHGHRHTHRHTRTTATPTFTQRRNAHLRAPRLDVRARRAATNLSTCAPRATSMLLRKPLPCGARTPSCCAACVEG